MCFKNNYVVTYLDIMENYNVHYYEISLFIIEAINGSSNGLLYSILFSISGKQQSCYFLVCKCKGMDKSSILSKPLTRRP